MSDNKTDRPRPISFQASAKHNSSRCCRCGDAIVWVTTAAGKKMPVNDTAHAHEILEPLTFGVDTVTIPSSISHFSTCRSR